MWDEAALSREARAEIWRSGTPLNDAWYKFGDERQKKLHDERRGDPSSLVFQEILIGDVFADLRSGDLIALGYRVAPDLSDGPVQIPSDIFRNRPEPEWRDTRISASGWIYEDVAVLLRTNAHQLVVRAEQQDGQPSKQRPGRKDTYILCKSVLDIIYQKSRGLLALSSQKLYPEFKLKYDEIHGVLSKFSTCPSERTLRKHLDRYRLEEIGKNDAAE